MNEKLDSCTCPSGDGSLRHPCPTHPTTLAVDVLAVLRSQLTWIGPCRPDGDEIDCERWDRIESAIAATAELIEADEEYNRAREAWLASPGEHDDFQATRDAWKRRMKALTRIKGESA